MKPRNDFGLWFRFIYSIWYRRDTYVDFNEIYLNWLLLLLVILIIFQRHAIYHTYGFNNCNYFFFSILKLNNRQKLYKLSLWTINHPILSLNFHLVQTPENNFTINLSALKKTYNSNNKLYTIYKKSAAMSIQLFPQENNLFLNNIFLT